ncbi:hypothetical protein FNV43_RR04235 [Rhamnella rubrinervis]|uniref:Uncharacterized protein n=1 Tax=Rhamnella rubrinervis TaxID=2594499 RepID=A0A8K0HLG8_9ROSA|nr:hypothetical protein FNV43_RR04235 [Rhamnella rubrinervis]
MEDGASTAEFPTKESQQIRLTGNAPNEHQITNNQDGHVEEAENEGGGVEMENVEVPTSGGTKKMWNNKKHFINKEKTAKGENGRLHPPHMMRFVGNYSIEFVTEIGVTVRYYDKSHHTYNLLEESFEFNEDVIAMSALDAQMRRSFRTWRYRLYERVKKAHKEEDIAAIKPEHITEEEWMIFSTSLTIDEIFAKALPFKPTAFRGISVIPKPNKLQASLEVAGLRKILEEYKRGEKENNATYSKLLKKNQQLEVRLSKMEKKVKILLELHERQFDSFDRMVADMEGNNDTKNGDTSNQGKVDLDKNELEGCLASHGTYSF